MKTKKFFTDIQNFWAPKISAEIFAEFDNFCLVRNFRKISDHCQNSKNFEALNLGKI